MMKQKQGQVLIVEDNRLNRTRLAHAVQGLGHQAKQAEDGRQALEMLRQQAFDLLLLDILLPEIDGYQVLQTLKSDPASAEIPVIVISAVDEMDSVVRCIEIGAEDYLPKPFDPVLLKARIQASLSKKWRRDQDLADLQDLKRLSAAAAAIEAGSFDPDSLQPVTERTDELGNLGRVFQKMAGQVLQRETTLKQQLSQLQIDLDRARQSSQVAEITESEYFQDLQSKTNDLRRIIGGE